MAEKKSGYTGYTGRTKDGATVMFREPTTKESARGAKYSFDMDKEGMKTGYETYKMKDDPTSEQISKKLGSADEDAIAKVKAAGRAEDSESRREENRAKAMKSVNETGSFKKGGMIKSSASKRADGCAKRGKTRGKMI